MNFKKVYDLTFSKLIVAFLTLNSTIWIYCSYWLAYIGRTQIAETLSKAVVVEILGVIALYSLKALFENLSKNNSWPDRRDTKETEVDRDL